MTPNPSTDRPDVVVRAAPGPVSPAERTEIHRLRLVERLSYAAISKKLGRTRETIASHCQGKDFEALQTAVEAEIKQTLRIAMVGKSEAALAAWEKALDAGADRGNHKPALDMLERTRLIEAADYPVPRLDIRVGCAVDAFVPAPQPHDAPAASHDDDPDAIRTEIARLEQELHRLGVDRQGHPLRR